MTSIVSGQTEGGMRSPAWGSVKWIVALGASAIVSYYTAQQKLEVGQARLDERENAHYAEVLRRLDGMGQDIRDLRDQIAGARMRGVR